MFLEEFLWSFIKSNLHLHLIHHGEDYDLEFADIHVIRPCLEHNSFKVGVLWCVLVFFVSLQLENGKETQAYVYGLCSNTEYEVRVRSKMRGYNFGVFSDSIFILISNKGQFKHLPVCRFWKEGRMFWMSPFIFRIKNSCYSCARLLCCWCRNNLDADYSFTSTKVSTCSVM